MEKDILDTLIDLAFREDLSDLGDVISQAIFTEQRSEAVLKSKDIGILAGSAVFIRVFHRADERVKVTFLKKDGDALNRGDTVATLKGPLVSILKGERIALNFLCYLSGIATSARTFMDAAVGKTLILDTRKTLPGYRALAKSAVLSGGARNHRMGLYDMVMIKDNHIDGAGSITSAVKKVRDKWGDKFAVEVECRTIREVREAIACSVDVVMLDNMDTDKVREAVEVRISMDKENSGKPLFEVSGNMDLEKIGVYSMAGIDYISIGKMTHSVRAFDFSLILKKNGPSG